MNTKTWTVTVLVWAVSASLPAATFSVTSTADSGPGTPSNTDGLRVLSGQCTIRALVINRFKRDGILLSGGGTNVVEGCIIGADADGTIPRNNTANGILILHSAGNLIGGAAAAGNVIQGNIIGADVTGSVALQNNSHGVQFASSASNNTVGGTAPGQGNIIAFNGTTSSIDGVFVAGGTGNAIRGNSIFAWALPAGSIACGSRFLDANHLCAR